MSTSASVTRARRRVGDVVFSGAARSAALLILIALAGVAIFLGVEGAPALSAGSDALGGASNFAAYVGPLRLRHRRWRP